jgi:hypothetical protein
LIRHALLRLPATAAIGPLVIAMIAPTRVALLVTSIGASALLAAGMLTAGGAAIALSAIAVRADEENRVASNASPLPENRFAMNCRHASLQAGLDNDNRFVAG